MQSVGWGTYLHGQMQCRAVVGIPAVLAGFPCKVLSSSIKFKSLLYENNIQG